MPRERLLVCASSTSQQPQFSHTCVIIVTLLIENAYQRAQARVYNSKTKRLPSNFQLSCCSCTYAVVSSPAVTACLVFECLDRWFDSHLEFYFLETPTPLLLFEKQTVFCFCCLLFCVRSPARPFCRSILILLPARNPGSKISLKNVGFSFLFPQVKNETLYGVRVACL